MCWLRFVNFFLQVGHSCWQCKYNVTLSDWHQPLVTLRPSCTSLMCCLRSEYRLPHTGQARLCFWWTLSENRNNKDTFKIFFYKIHWWCASPGRSWDSNYSRTLRTCSSSTEKALHNLAHIPSHMSSSIRNLWVLLVDVMFEICEFSEAMWTFCELGRFVLVPNPLFLCWCLWIRKGIILCCVIIIITFVFLTRIDPWWVIHRLCCLRRAVLLHFISPMGTFHRFITHNQSTKARFLTSDLKLSLNRHFYWYIWCLVDSGLCIFFVSRQLGPGSCLPLLLQTLPGLWLVKGGNTRLLLALSSRHWSCCIFGIFNLVMFYFIQCHTILIE